MKGSFLVATFMLILASSTSFAAGGNLSDFLKNRDQAESRSDTKTNDEPFKVIVEMDRKDQTYVPGETFQVKVQSERAGYIYIANVKGDSSSIIFPNVHAKAEFKIEGGKQYIFPSESAPFKWRVNDELGTEQIVVVVSEQPLDGLSGGTKNAGQDLLDLTNRVVIEPNFAIARGAAQFNVVKERGQAERPSNTPKRIAMIFSVTHTATKDGKLAEDSRYKYRIGNLITITSLLKQYGCFDNIYYLAGQDFIKKNVKAAFQTLAEKTKEGDEIFIYWEGHGGTGIHDESSTESDKKHEYLCLYDVYSNPNEGIILDDEFANIVSVLAGRRVMMLIETCHSGGLLESGTARSMNDNFPSIDVTNVINEIDEYCNGNVDFSNEIAQIKNVLGDSDAEAEDKPLRLSDFFASENKNSENKSDKTEEKGRTLSSFFKSVSDDESGELFLGNFSSRIKSIYKNDIRPDTPNLAIIFTASKHEGSYCPMVDASGNILTFPDAKGNKWPIGVPTYCLFVTMTDTKGGYVKDKSRTTLEDVWNIAKTAIPANAKRIAQLSETERGATQVPVYMNTIPDVCVRPSAQQ